MLPFVLRERIRKAASRLFAEAGSKNIGMEERGRNEDDNWHF